MAGGGQPSSLTRPSHRDIPSRAGAGVNSPSLSPPSLPQKTQRTKPKTKQKTHSTNIERVLGKWQAPPAGETCCLPSPAVPRQGAGPARCGAAPVRGRAGVPQAAAPAGPGSSLLAPSGAVRCPGTDRRDTRLGTRYLLPGSPFSPVNHVVLRSSGQGEGTVRFLAALRKARSGNITSYVAGTKRAALYFSYHLGKSQAARWRHYWQRPGVWLSGRPEQHSRPCLRSRPGAAAAPVLWCCRPGRAAGKAAGTPRTRNASLSH